MKAYCNEEGKLVIDLEDEVITGNFIGSISGNMIIKNGIFINNQGGLMDKEA